MSLLLAPPLAMAHAASKGLHLHIDPPAALPGAELRITIESAEEFSEVRLGVGSEKPLVRRLEKPARTIEIVTRLPAGAPTGTTVSLHAEARALSRTTVRAAAIVPVGDPRRPIVLQPEPGPESQ